MTRPGQPDVRVVGRPPHPGEVPPGATLDTEPTPPDGYRLLRVERILGRGRHAWERAVDGLLTWEMHRRAGMEVAAEGMADLGTVVRLRPTWGPAGALRISGECTVVAALDGPDARGFAYATRPGHPERGEESFVVSIDPTGREVRARIVALSRPESRLARLAGPLGRMEQDRATGRYLDALRLLAAGR